MKNYKTIRGYLGSKTISQDIPVWKDCDIEEIEILVSGKKPITIKIIDESTETEFNKGEHFYIDIDLKKKIMEENINTNIVKHKI